MLLISWKGYRQERIELTGVFSAFQVSVQRPGKGRWKISVRGYNVPLGGRQPFAVVASGPGIAPCTCASTLPVVLPSGEIVRWLNRIVIFSN